MQSVACKNCQHEFTGKFCNQCGEKVYSDHDKSLKHLFEEGFHFLTHFEGTFFNTLKAIVLKPGQLSSDFCFGIRKKYFKPLSFFLMLVILYLLFPIFEGLNMQLKYHQMGWYGDLARDKVQAVMASKNITEQELAELFHRKGEKASKFLLFLTLPFMALLSWRMGFRKRRFYFDHFIFTTEAVSLFMLWGFLVFPFLLRIVSIMAGRELLPQVATALLIPSVFMFYLYAGSKRFFEFTWYKTLIYTVIFTASLAFFLQYIYKFILFIVSISLV